MKKTKPILILVLKLLVSVGLLGYLLARIHIERFLQTFANANFSYIAIALLVYLVTQGVSAMRWTALARPLGVNTPFKDMARYYLIGMKILREKKEQTIAVKIGELPDDDPNQQLESRDDGLGLRVQRITPEAARRLGLSSTRGVLVLEVQPDSPADVAGLEPADVIREVNQRPITNVKDFERAVRQGRRGERVLLLVQRGDNAVFFGLKRRS